MRQVPQAMTEAWRSPAKVGPRRPVVRATISIAKLQTFPYDTRYSAGTDEDGHLEDMKNRMGHFTSILFGSEQTVREIPNIRSYSWSRSVDSDVAEATLTIKNTMARPVGEVYDGPDFDQPGFLSANRGELGGLWGHEENSWSTYFMPDRLVKTYEGYGTDPTQAPGQDPNLVPSGTWLIDTVTVNAGGDLVLKMRDLNRLLLDQIVFPPTIPYEEYPLSFDKIRSEEVLGRVAEGGKWSGVLAAHGVARSSNTRYLSEPDYETGHNYVEPDGSVQGHHARDALTRIRSGGNAMDPEDPEPYWLSTGQEDRWSKVWWEFRPNNPRDLASIRMSVYGGPYVIYVSLQRADGTWYGQKRIPYEVTTKGVNLGAGKKFVHQQVAERGKIFDIVLKRIYPDVKRVRITFTRLTDSRSGSEFPWHAGLKNFELYWGDKNQMWFGQDYTLRVTGNYRDYTDIVKQVCAWGGYFWPGGGTRDDDGAKQSNYVLLGWENPGGLIDRKRYVRYANYDIRLAKGRVWGDFMNTGTAGQVPLSQDLFDKQPLLDIINYVRDITGFLFFCDETGGAVWRMPNIFEPGNYLSPTTMAANTRRRVEEYVTLDDATTILDWSVDTSSENNREVIFVSNLNGRRGVAINGYAPANANLRRTAGWTDAHFEDRQESRVAADMIATQQMYAYRRGRVTIPGYPAIQVDDQIRIFERVTAESYFHYVSGIECSLDMESGEYTYDLTTNWLGPDASSLEAITYRMDYLTREYIRELQLAGADNGVDAEIEDEPKKGGR